MILSKFITMLLDVQDSHGGDVAVVFDDFALEEVQVVGMVYERGNGDQLNRLVLYSEDSLHANSAKG